MPKRRRAACAPVALSVALAAIRLPAAGQTLEEMVQTCAACHGENGVPQEPTAPIVSGQHQGYLYLQLRDYKLGTRKNELMTPIAEALERKDMMALAEYFSKQPWPNLNQPRTDEETARRALRANASVNCTGCHLAEYQGTGTIPRLAGQKVDYTAKTLAAFRTRERANNPGMSDVAIATAPEDLDALAKYVAGL